MSQKLPVNNFEWIEDTSPFNEDFIMNYNEESDEGYFLEVDVQYPEKLHEPHNDLPFLPERMKLEKVKKLVTNLHDKTKYVIDIRNLEQALNHMRKHRSIKLVTTERRRNYLVSQPKCHTTKFFSENLLAIEMRKTQIIMNKPVYLGLSILDLSKTVTYKFWCDYVKLKYDENAKLCQMVHINTDTDIQIKI